MIDHPWLRVESLLPLVGLQELWPAFAELEIEDVCVLAQIPEDDLAAVVDHETDRWLLVRAAKCMGMSFSLLACSLLQPLFILLMRALVVEYS
jgi:hypothetical protein